MLDRLRAMHLATRLPAGSLAEAAHAGLQDTAPRAGLLSLHARVEGVTSTSWEDPALAQVYGPREAAWIVPRDAVASFTLGRLPRDPDRVRQIEAWAEVSLAGTDEGMERRFGAPAARYLLRWDGRSSSRIVPAEPPDVDPEDARRDLARRYLTWFGESMRDRFARWAGVDEADAAETLRHVEPVELPPEEPVEGVRLLPLLDPYVYGQQTPTSPHREIVGTILVDGRMHGTWARKQHTVVLRPPSTKHVDRIEAEAASFAGPIGRPIKISVQSDPD